MKPMFRSAALAFLLALPGCQATPPSPTPRPTSTPAPTTSLAAVPSMPLPTPTASARPSPVAEDGPLLAAATLRRAHDFGGRVTLFQPLSGGELSELEKREFKVSGPEDTEGAYIALMRRPQSDQMLINVRGFKTWLWSPSATPKVIALPDPMRYRYTSELRWSPDGRWLAVGDAGSVILWDPDADEIRTIARRTDSEPSGWMFAVAGWTADAKALVVSIYGQTLGCFPAPALRRVDLNLNSGGSTPFGGTGEPAVGSARADATQISLDTGEGVQITDAGRVSIAGACSAAPNRSVELPESAHASGLTWSADGRALYILGAFDGASHVWTYGSDYRLLADNALPVEVEWLSAISSDGRWLVAREPSDYGPAQCAAHVIDLARNTSWPVNPCSVGQTGPETFRFPSFAWVDPPDQP